MRGLVKEFSCSLSIIKPTRKRKNDYQEAFCKLNISLSKTQKFAATSERLRDINE